MTGLLLAIAATTLPTGAARASLGGNVDSISSDTVHMALRAHAVASATSGPVHTLTLANGGTVKEYVASDGLVFAISWQGPGKPDLRTLLGTHFDALQTDNPVGRRHGIRRAPVVDRSDLQIATGGHPGAFWGFAWLPQSAPAGFDPAQQ